MRYTQAHRGASHLDYRVQLCVTVGDNSSNSDDRDQKWLIIDYYDRCKVSIDLLFSCTHRGQKTSVSCQGPWKKNIFKYCLAVYFFPEIYVQY